MRIKILICLVLIRSVLCLAQNSEYETHSAHSANTVLNEIFQSSIVNDLLSEEKHYLFKMREEYGFKIDGMLIGEAWGNLNGGVKRGAVADTLLAINISEDFSKLFSKDGLGEFDLGFMYYESTNNFTSRYVRLGSSPGNIFPAQESMYRFYKISYTNSFETRIGESSFSFGLMSADESFMGICYASLFLNSNFGAIPTNAMNTLAGGEYVAFSQYPNSSLGVLYTHTYEDTEFSIGFYNGNAGRDVSSNIGFDYRFDADSGFAMWYQLTQKFKINGKNGAASFGGNYHSGAFDNFSTGESEKGFYSFYMMFDQCIFSYDNKDKLGIFCRLAYAPKSEISMISKSIDFGFNVFDPFSYGGKDIFGIGVSLMNYSSDYRDSDSDLRSWETCTEITYKYFYNDYIILQPTLQLYFGEPKIAGESQSMPVVMGLRVEILL